MYIRCDLREIEAGSMHSWYLPSPRRRPCNRDALHPTWPPRFLHHKRRPDRVFQFLQFGIRRLLRRGAAELGPVPEAERRPAFLHEDRHGHHRGRGVRPRLRRCEVRRITVPQAAQQAIEAQIPVPFAPVADVGGVLYTGGVV